MRKALRQLQQTLNTQAWANAAFALLIVTYILVGLRAANSVWFTMDESSYLFKGYWFLTGQASPFEINGPVSNKPPLAFLIPGLSQLVQSGIASGRVMNVLMLAAALIGIGLIIRRRHNPWWANLAAALVVINPAWVEYYTRVMTQTPAIFLMVWSLYFSTDEKGGNARLMIGAAIGALLILTRHNLAPYSVLLFVYTAWRFTFKKAIVVTLPAVILFLAINTFYWPGIFTLFWYRSLPKELGDPLIRMFNLTAPILVNKHGQAVDHTLAQTMQELFGSAKISLSAVLTALAALALIKPGAKLKEGKTFVFITLNFWLLTLVHATVVFDKGVLLYSYTAYLLFWAPTILILLPDIAELIRDSVGQRAAWALVSIYVVICAGIGMNLYRSVSDPLLNLLVPRVSGFSLQAGTVELWRVIVNKFGVEYRAQEYLVPTLVGFLFGLALLAAALLLSRRTGKPVWSAFMLLFIISSVFTPTRVLSGKKTKDECRSDTLAAIQRVGDQINSQVKPNSLIFWGGHTNPTIGVLLYVDQARVFPEQLNGQFYYRADLSLQESQDSIFWSDAQAKEWFKEADYLISDPGHLAHWDEILNKMPEVQVDQLKPTDPLEPCDRDTSLYIFRLKH